MNQLDKIYNPKNFEDRLYEKWKENGYFKGIIDKNKKPFTIVMPPPNVTGNLHLGHAMNNTVQDILIRWKRMKGYSTLWIPGTDHASISTEAKVVAKLKSQGKEKEKIGREEFLKEAWNWTDEYGGNIKKQLEKLGISCDWSRDSFTLDENLSEAVSEVFIKMYNDNLIYQGDRIVNWCSNCKTAISDIEVEYKEDQGKLYYIKYYYKDSDEYISIATTRPETIFGDLAVAVNPEDERYKNCIGRHILVPLVDREVELIADSYVDMEFGTGAVKITPSHDLNDFEVGKRHNLGQCVVIDNYGKISQGFGEFSGLEREKARIKAIEKLKELNLLIKEEDIKHNVGHCERCKTKIEPLISKQWFVKMDKLADMAKKAYLSGEIKLIPDRFGKIYVNWLDNIKDWCISRQLWWGHRLPVYYNQETGEILVSKTSPDGLGTKYIQDEDTLDTWFSSALWPFSTLGWPEKTKDLEYFFPTDVLVTGYDIIFFWVIRMIFSSLYNMKEVPFKQVYFTGLIRDEIGRKMSKSLNNGIDPLDIIEEYGADALRYSLVVGNTPGNDLRFFEKKVLAYRNFANKIWNATRFIFMNLEDNKNYKLNFENLLLEDKWILSRYNETIGEIEKNLEKFEFGLAANKLYDFVWEEFCDWYIELVKPRLYNDDTEVKDNALSVLVTVLTGIIKLLHPFMPFITEEIYSYMPNKKDMLINEVWPEKSDELSYPEYEKDMEIFIKIVTEIRNFKNMKKIPQSKKINLIFETDNHKVEKFIENFKNNFHNLAYVENIEIKENFDDENAISIVFEKFKVFVPLEELVDINEEILKFEKELGNLDFEIKRAKSKLENEKFVSKAPQKLVDEEREKLKKYMEIYEKTKSSVEKLKGSL